MLAARGRSKDEEASKVIFEAMLCKAFSCRPSELRQESFEDVILFGLALMEMAKKNPLLML